MDAREYLEDIQKADSVIQNKLAEVQQLRCLALSVTAPIGGEGVQGTKETDRMGKAIAKIVDLENEINADIDKFIHMKRERTALIQRIPKQLQYDIIHGHYVQYKSLVDIAKEKGYTYAWILEVHAKALQTVQGLIENTYDTPIETYG